MEDPVIGESPEVEEVIIEKPVAIQSSDLGKRIKFILIASRRLYICNLLTNETVFIYNPNSNRFE